MGAVPFPDSRKPGVFKEALQLGFLSFPPRTPFPVGVQECDRGSAAATSGPASLTAGGGGGRGRSFRGGDELPRRETFKTLISEKEMEEGGKDDTHTHSHFLRPAVISQASIFAA